MAFLGFVYHLNKKFIKIEKLVRSWKRIDESKFVCFVKNYTFFCKGLKEDNVDKLYDQFTCEMRQIADNVAPIHLIKIRQDPLAPWFNNELKRFKSYCRQKKESIDVPSK